MRACCCWVCAFCMHRRHSKSFLLNRFAVTLHAWRSAWDALLLAAFMNLRAGLYYELLSCFMGKGDKETFAAALAAVSAPYAVASTPLGSAGLRRTSCRHGCVVPATLLPWSASLPHAHVCSSLRLSVCLCQTLHALVSDGLLLG